MASCKLRGAFMVIGYTPVVRVYQLYNKQPD